MVRMNKPHFSLSSVSKKSLQVPPIEKLPDEVLDSVFESMVAAYNDDPRIRATLRRVCRRWNDVVLGNPTLWTRISVGVSVAAVSDSSTDTPTKVHSTKSRRKGTVATGRGGVVKDSTEVHNSAHDEGSTSTDASASSDASMSSGGSGCGSGAGGGLGTMPSLEFVKVLLGRSGELNISLGMTVCDLDADTVMVRLVRVEDVQSRYEDVTEDVWDGEDTEPDEPSGPSTTGSSVNFKAQNLATSPPLDPQKMLAGYFHGLVELLAANVHRLMDFHLYFVSEHTALVPSTPPKTSPSFPSLIALLPLHRGFNLRSVSITSHLIRMTNSHSSTHTANHTIFDSLIRPLPPSIRRLHWQGNTPHIDFTSFAGFKYLTHVDIRGILGSEDVLGILCKAENAKTIRVHVDSVHAGFVNSSGEFAMMENVKGLSIKSGCEVFRILGMCVKMPKLGICCIEVPHPVPKQQWHDPVTANGQGNPVNIVNGGITIRNAWEWFCVFLNRCPKLKILQLYDPHGAIPIDMIKDIVCAVKDSALGLFLITPGAEWLRRPEVDKAFWERLEGIRHPREDDVKVSTLRDKDGKAWVSVGWLIDPCAEVWLRSEENQWAHDTGFRWDILNEYHV